MGKTYTKPTLVLFRNATTSGCGNASSASGPFYCPVDHDVYIDLSFAHELNQRFNASGDFAMAYVVAHEVGHHVQYLLGITKKMERIPTPYLIRIFIVFSIHIRPVVGILSIFCVIPCRY